jgi:hypothetical protein
LHADEAAAFTEADEKADRIELVGTRDEGCSYGQDSPEEFQAGKQHAGRNPSQEEVGRDRPKDLASRM